MLKPVIMTDHLHPPVEFAFILGPRPGRGGLAPRLPRDSGLTLRVGDLAFALSDAAEELIGERIWAYIWSAPDIDWTVGDIVEVVLEVRPKRDGEES